MNSYYDALIIGPVEKPVFKFNAIYQAVLHATGRPNSHCETPIGVDYADIAAEYIATMVLGG